MTARTPIYSPGVMRVQLRPYAKRRARQWLSQARDGRDIIQPMPSARRYAQNIVDVLLLGIDPDDAEGIDPHAL